MKYLRYHLNGIILCAIFMGAVGMFMITIQALLSPDFWFWLIGMFVVFGFAIGGLFLKIRVIDHHEKLITGHAQRVIRFKAKGTCGMAKGNWIVGTLIKQESSGYHLITEKGMPAAIDESTLEIIFYNDKLGKGA